MKLTTGNMPLAPTLDIDSLDRIVVESGTITSTYQIKDGLKELGMEWDGSRWYYKPKNDDDAIRFLKAVNTEFPGLESREQDFVDFVNNL